MNVSRKEKLAAILEEFEGSYADGWTASSFEPDRYLLIEENVNGGYWLSAWADPDSAADYHVNQEYASEWTETELLIDVDTGAEFEPGRATFVWQPSRHSGTQPAPVA